jgi:stage V sporulation protein B
MGFLKKEEKVIKKEIVSEENDIKEIWRRIKERDFSGNTGIVVKNSVYQLSTQFIAKIGSLIFTIILARLLMPELFGLYSLVLSTIVIFAAVSEMGVGSAIVRFVSKELGKGKKVKKTRVKSYLFYLGKIKIFLVVLSSFLLIIFSGYLANNFYQKPIFLALIAGVLYLVFIQIAGFFQSTLEAANNFNPIFKKEILFQVSRVVLVSLAVFFSLKYALSSELILMFIIIFLAFSFLLASLFLFFNVKRFYFKKILNEKSLNLKLSKKQKKITNSFLFATAVLAFSGTFFGNIDRIMLGKFVEGEFIGYYSASFSLIGALIPLIGFSSIVLLPIFSRLKGKRLEMGFKKSIRITFLLALGVVAITLLLANPVISVIYGKEYFLSINILRILSLLLFTFSLTGIYQTYYISQGKPGNVAKLLIIATIFNILLNYIFITILLPSGYLAAVYGVAIATIISQGLYLGGLIWFKNK